VTQQGVLYVIATPIGNLADISARAREVLGLADLVASEDTRRTGRLLQALGLSRPMLSLHEHNERARTPGLLERLQAGEVVALVSDAGTPLVSDPGFLLVRAAIDAGIKVSAVPGPCAAIAALSVAGLPTDRFVFEGFLPARTGARRRRLELLARETRTLVFYESPQRLVASLGDLAAACGDQRRACVARELTKLHESLYHGSLDQLLARARVDADMQRGELVLVVEGAPTESTADAQEADRVLGVLVKSLPPSQAAGIASALTGLSRQACYARALELTGRGT